MMKVLASIIMTFLLVSNVNAQHNHNSDGALNAASVNAEHSLYHLNAEWTDHRGDNYSLIDFKGKPVIVVMFYGNCTDVCPILIQDAWRLYNSLDASLQDSVNVIAISFDTENDTPEVLADYAEYEQLNIRGWHFMISKQQNVRTLATLLGVQYSKKSDGHFAHSNLVTVLDKQGKIAKRIEGLNQPMDEAAAAIEAIINNNDLQ